MKLIVLDNSPLRVTAHLLRPYNWDEDGQITLCGLVSPHRVHKRFPSSLFLCGNCERSLEKKRG